MAAPAKKAQDLNARMDNCEKWVKALSGLAYKEGDFHGNLESGVALCMAINKLKAGMVQDKYAKAQAKKLNAFQKRERIAAFIEGCKKFGVNQADIFMVEDLFMKNNLKQVVITLENLSATASKNNIQQPFEIGIQYATANKRQFSKEQMQKAKNAIPAMNKGSVKVDQGGGLDSHGIILQGNKK
eukprot:CAMPEP_0197023046 /NCGR_PEP_ID=MMETSP1384-20130603/3839_1 /TAXON_ID=29189 /ORGANISM="Ammonia sp." /LENGTH=184 /DNA_ID=CAMNT_0042451195 /DNA_START=26 /DNA_END=580 /DNA_ORIENTATION=+